MKLVLVGVVLSAAFAGVAVADEFPQRKPGEWELSILRGQTPAATMKMCIDKDTDAAFLKLGNGATHQLCQHSDIKVSGNVVTIASECTIAGSKITSSSITRFDGDSAFHVEVKSHFEPAFLGKTDTLTQQEGKWIGDCPGDMKPGDVVVGRGVKINIKMLEALQKRFQH